MSLYFWILSHWVKKNFFLKKTNSLRFYSVIKIKKQALAAFKRYNPTAVVLLALCYILYLLHIYSVVFELRISRHLPPTLTILLFHGITQESGTINKVVQVFLSILQMGCIWIFFMHNAFRVHWLDAHMVKRGIHTLLVRTCFSWWMKT